jgi:hypothetical protein
VGDTPRPAAEFDARQGNLLDAQHVRQRHRGLTAFHFHLQILAACTLLFFCFFALFRALLICPYSHSGLGGNGSGIENQRQFGIAQHGGARVHADILEYRAQGFDHNLFRIGKAIDHQAKAPAIGVEHGDEVVAGRIERAFLTRHEQAIEKN